jgi:required for meiotic nuclear division protein 1
MPMKSYSFTVYSLFNEMDLNKLAAHFGVKRKLEWEDFLRIEGSQLQGIVRDAGDKSANLYAFGSGVFINMEHHEIVDFISYITKIDTALKNPQYEYTDEYNLTVEDDRREFTNDMMIVNELSPYHIEIISNVLAKSVALEKIEKGIGDLFDELEGLIQRLKVGNLRYRGNMLAKMSARILTFKYDTTSVIMILDKPEITWTDEMAEKLFNRMSRLFELDERYEKIAKKSDTLMDILSVFSTLTQHQKSNNLEWMIIILIVIEIVISLIDFFLFKLS